ncbi:MAG: response regulator [Gemmatimonadota bacterium]
MKFLVVDESATMRRIVANSLERIGYSDCVEACSGSEALANIATAVDFVITAAHLPDMEGTDLVRALRASPLGTATPILVMAPRRARGDAAAARDAGANDCLMKPFTTRTLRAKVASAVAAPALGA